MSRIDGTRHQFALASKKWRAGLRAWTDASQTASLQANYPMASNRRIKMALTTGSPWKKNRHVKMTEMTNPLGSRHNFRCDSDRYRAVWTAAILAPRISQALMDPPIWKFSITRSQLDRFLSNQCHRDVWLKQWICSQKWLHLELKAHIGPRRWFLKWLSQNLWPTKKSFDLKPRRTRIRNDPEQDEGVQTNQITFTLLN